jgi:hypothetical protein
MHNLILSPISISELDILIQSAVRKALNENKTKDLTAEDDECDINEASEITGRAVSTIYCDVHAKTIPHFRRGRKLVFSKKELLSWKTPSKTAEEIDEAASNYIVNHKK